MEKTVGFRKNEKRFFLGAMGLKFKESGGWN